MSLKSIDGGTQAPAELRHRYFAKNERMKYRYRTHLLRVGRKDEKTVVAALKHIRCFEVLTEFADFTEYSDECAHRYIDHLFATKKSLSYISSNVREIKSFLTWLERQKGYRSKINYEHIEYLEISNNQRRAAHASSYKPSHSFGVVVATIRVMPDATIIDRRNKAMVALQACCSLRTSELRSIKIKNLIRESEGGQEITNGRVTYFIDANPRDMETKFAKSRQVVLLPLGDDILGAIVGWRDYLLELGFSKSSPLFPVICHRFGKKGLFEDSLTTNAIQSNGTILKVFKDAFEAAGHSYLNPHSFRHTVARYAQHQSPAFLNAVRQNLGHSSIDTTLSSYGNLSRVDQANILNSIKIELPGHRIRGYWLRFFTKRCYSASVSRWGSVN